MTVSPTHSYAIAAAELTSALIAASTASNCTWRAPWFSSGSSLASCPGPRDKVRIPDACYEAANTSSNGCSRSARGGYSVER